MEGAGCHSGRLGIKKERPESSNKTPAKAHKKAYPQAGLSLGLLIDLGSHETNDDHDTKKTSNNGENGAVKTSHVILLAFGTLFQK